MKMNEKSIQYTFTKAKELLFKTTCTKLQEGLAHWNKNLNEGYFKTQK